MPSQARAPRCRPGPARILPGRWDVASPHISRPRREPRGSGSLTSAAFRAKVRVMRRLLRIARGRRSPGRRIFARDRGRGAPGQAPRPRARAAPASSCDRSGRRAASRHGAPVRPRRQVVSTLDLAAISGVCHEQTVAIDDLYYGRRKSFRACPLAEVLQAGLTGPHLSRPSAATVHSSARAAATRPSTGAQLLEPGGFLAFADAERTPPDGPPAWEPIDRRQADPARTTWSQGSPVTRSHTLPWPYQLARIEIASLASSTPTSCRPPERGISGAARLRDLQVDCRLHALNGEGADASAPISTCRGASSVPSRERIRRRTCAIRHRPLATRRCPRTYALRRAPISTL